MELSWGVFRVLRASQSGRRQGEREGKRGTNNEDEKHEGGGSVWDMIEMAERTGRLGGLLGCVRGLLARVGTPLEREKAEKARKPKISKSTMVLAARGSLGTSLMGLPGRLGGL